MDPTNSGNQPAGFFSTFSVLDLNGNTRESPVRIQKRNRRVFVCIPCHQRKLKCDKERPCSRCVRSGSADECIYQPLPPSRKSRQGSTSSGPDLEDFTKGGSGSSPGSPCSESRIRLNGITHWRNIASEFEEAWPYIVGINPEWQPRYRQIKDLGCLFSSLPKISFSLGDASQYTRDRHQVLATLPTRQLIETLVQCYFVVFEPIHRLIHAQEFYSELNAFWVDHNQQPDIWFSQLCMMAALGCRAAPDHIFRGSGGSAEDWTDLLLDAAQFFYGECPLSTAPSLTTVRTLCLIVTARMMDIVKGTTVPQLVSLMGVTIRLAMTIHLHRTTSLFPEIGAFEAEMRRRVWVTIQLLDVDIAMRTGTSYICRDHDADAPLNLDDTDISLSARGWTLDVARRPSSSPGPYTDSTFQIKLSELLPLLAEIINTINSPTQKNIEYTKLQDWAAQLQQKLKEAEDELSMGVGIGQHLRPEAAEIVNTQRQFLRVLVHRALMAMSHEFITTTQARRKCPIATRIVVRSAILLLRIHMAWYSPSQGYAGMTAPSRTPSPLMHPDPALPTTGKPLTNWLVDLCHDDFGAAMLYLMLALRGRYVDRIQNDDKSDLPPRAEMWSILRHSLNIFGDRARQSLSQFKEFTGLSIAAGCLQSMETGEPVMPLLQDVAREIERRVLFNSDSDSDRHELDVVGMGHLWSAPGNANNAHHHQHQHLAPLPVDFPTDLFEFNFC